MSPEERAACLASDGLAQLGQRIMGDVSVEFDDGVTEGFTAEELEAIGRRMYGRV